MLIDFHPYNLVPLIPFMLNGRVR